MFRALQRRREFGNHNSNYIKESGLFSDKKYIGATS